MQLKTCHWLFYRLFWHFAFPPCTLAGPNVSYTVAAYVQGWIQLSGSSICHMSERPLEAKHLQVHSIYLCAQLDPMPLSIVLGIEFPFDSVYVEQSYSKVSAVLHPRHQEYCYILGQHSEERRLHVVSTFPCIYWGFSRSMSVSTQNKSLGFQTILTSRHLAIALNIASEFYWEHETRSWTTCEVHTT